MNFFSFRIVYIIYLLFISVNAFAYDTKVIVDIVGEEKTWDVGEQKEIKISLYPISEVVDKDIKQELIARDFVDMIRIVNVEKQYFLKTNPEYYVVEAYAVLVNVPKNNFPQIWNYKGLAVAVDFNGIQFLNEQSKLKDFVVLDKAIKGEFYNTLLVVLLLVIIMITLGVFFYLKKIRVKKIEKQEYERLVNILMSASTRDDHEMIYRNRASFEKLISDIELYKQYLSEINKIQYKRNWTEQDLRSAEQLHSIIKENLIVK